MIRIRSLSRIAVWSAFAVVFNMGCNPASLSYFLFKGDGKAPAANPLKAPEGKKEIAVAIMMAAPNASIEFAGVDRDLSRFTAKALVELSKGNKTPIKVVDAGKVERFKTNTPGWKSLPVHEIGRQLGVDFVIDATVSGLTMYEPGTGKLMYQGLGTVDATVHDVAGQKEHCRYYVNARLEQRASDSMPSTQYRTLLMQRIADEISWQHLPHVTDRRVTPVQ
jgi:hypothetical protein